MPSLILMECHKQNHIDFAAHAKYIQMDPLHQLFFSIWKKRHVIRFTIFFLFSFFFSLLYLSASKSLISANQTHKHKETDTPLLKDLHNIQTTKLTLYGIHSNTRSGKRLLMLKTYLTKFTIDMRIIVQFYEEIYENTIGPYHICI